MKKRMLLFTASIALLSFLVTSYNAGPAHGGQGNHTGSQNSVASCSGGGCHATNNPIVTDTVLFFKPDGVTGVLSWLPGQSYKIRLLVTSTNINYVRYGFQMTSVCDSGTTEVQAGTFIMPFPGNVDDISVTGTTGSPIQIVEHVFKQNMTPNTVKSTGTVTLNWTAPNTDTIDNVKFYVIANCVDANNLSTGDAPNNAMWVFPRNTTSVKELNADIKLNLYPNPVTDKLNISMENADKGLYTIKIFDVQGKVVAKEYAVVNKNYKTSINVAAWASGMYHVQISKDGAQRTMKVMK
jgi:hypothetical protein